MFGVYSDSWINSYRFSCYKGIKLNYDVLSQYTNMKYMIKIHLNNDNLQHT